MVFNHPSRNDEDVIIYSGDFGLQSSETKTGGTPYSATYTYDANGNRTKRERTIGTNPLQTDIYTYDQGDKLLNIARNGATWRTYAYNGLGETTSINQAGAVTTFNWNNDGRVTSMDLPGTTNDPSYAYNGMGTRESFRTVLKREAWVFLSSCHRTSRKQGFCGA